jgi:hypothetical protein
MFSAYYPIDKSPSEALRSTLTQQNGARLTEMLVPFAAPVSAQGREDVVSRRPASERVARRCRRA